MLKNFASQGIFIFVYDSAGELIADDSANVTGDVCIDDAVAVALTGTPVARGTGRIYFPLSAAETNGNLLGFTFSSTTVGARIDPVIVYPVQTPTASASSSGTLYASLVDLKTQLQITAATWDTLLTSFLTTASRGVDDFTGRHFDVKSETRYYSSYGGSILRLPDDLLTVTTLTTDSENDGTFDGETWVEDTDFILRPDNSNPKWEIRVHPTGNYSFGVGHPYVKIVGTFGFDSTVPEAVRLWTLWDAENMYRDYAGGGGGFEQERIGDYFYKRRTQDQYQLHQLRVLGGYVKRLG